MKEAALQNDKGGGKARYRITERCIACGTCLAVCRYDCIAGGRPPFVIRSGYCVGCGACAERCPVEAIIPVPD